MFIPPLSSSSRPLRVDLHPRLFYLLLAYSLSPASSRFFPSPDVIMKFLSNVLMYAYFAGSMLLAIIALNSRQVRRPALLAGIVGCTWLSFR